MSRVREAQDRAAQWIVARDEPGWNDRDQAEFDAWLNESDLNRITWLRLDEGWRQADRIRALGAKEMPVADMPVTEMPVGDLPAAETAPLEIVLSPYHSHERRWWIPPLIAASLTVMVVLAWFTTMPNGSWPIAQATTSYETPVGGHRKVGLTDGSQVELNTASTVRTAVNTERREIWLDRGEAYFEVTHDPSRPFVVHAGSRSVAVLGTKFSVRRDGEKVTVSVLEGRVRVDEVGNNDGGRSTTITGGDIAVAQGATTLVTAKSEERVESALAWREGMLVFDQARLGDIAAEFNRYNSKKLIIAGVDVGDMRLGGTFPFAEPRAFVTLLRDAYGLKVEESSDTIKISD